MKISWPVYMYMWERRACCWRFWQYCKFFIWLGAAGHWENFPSCYQATLDLITGTCLHAGNCKPHAAIAHSLAQQRTLQCNFTVELERVGIFYRYTCNRVYLKKYFSKVLRSIFTCGEVDRSSRGWFIFFLIFFLIFFFLLNERTEA